MKISSEILARQAGLTGFRPEMLEKTAQMLGLLNAIQSHPYLMGKLVLKGGTALNLFLFDTPRLSVDIDLNYVGAIDRDSMLAQRPKVEQALQAVFAREGFRVRRMPEDHAGGKWSLRYESASGGSGNLEVDINFMYRLPLWPVTVHDSRRLGTWQATRIHVLDQHELAAGKLAALLARKQARDIFDSQRILRNAKLDHDLLRIAFVVYGAMNRRDWRTVSAEDVDFDTGDLVRQLIPMLRTTSTSTTPEPFQYGLRIMMDCRECLSAVLPFTGSELKFLDLLLDQGIVDPSLLTSDPALQHRIQMQPLIEWKVLNVKRHKAGCD